MKAYIQRNLQKIVTVIMALISAMDSDIDELETAIANKKAVIDINPSAQTIADYEDGTIWIETE